MLVMLGAGAVRAEDAQQAPASARPVADGQLALPRQHLFGDWLGMRTLLEDHGITPTVTFVTDSLGNPTGGRQKDFTAANNLGIDLRFDLGRIAGLAGGSFAFSFSERFGSSLSKDDIGNAFTVQQVFGGETYRIIDLAYQQSLFNDRLSFRIGRIAAGDDFLVSVYDYVFVQNGFCGNPVGIFLNAPGMTAYPNAAWGALVKVKPTAGSYAMAGVYDGNPAIRGNEHHGADFSMAGPVFAIGEVGYRIDGLAGEEDLLGNYKAGFWYDGSRYIDFNTVAPGRTPTTARGNWGIYGLFDQVLVGFGGNRGLGVTGSILVSPDESVSQLPFFATAGVLIRGAFASRPTDVAGLGVVYGHFSGDLQDSQRRAQALTPSLGVQSHEIALELTWRFRFRGDALFVQPDLQYIFQPGGTGQIADALAAGFQAGLNL